MKDINELYEIVDFEEIASCVIDVYKQIQKNEIKFEVDKDLFKAKFIYSADFWKSQNQLPLTKELDTFLKLVADKKDKTKEYEVTGNF